MKNFLMAMVMACFMSMGIAYAGDKIDVNTATAVELQSVKGIGVKTAASIVTYREAHGAFNSLDDITGVKGIGDKKLLKLRDALMVSQVKKD